MRTRLLSPKLASRAFAVGLAAVALVSSTARAADDVAEVTATGEAAIVNGDKPAAKEKAVKAAQRNAVEQAFGTMVTGVSETKDFTLVKDQILTGASGYISGYEVVSEKEDGGVFTVTIKAKVGKGKISADAAARGLLLSAKGFPRLAVLISEQHIGQSAPSSWWGPQGGGQNAGGTIIASQRLAENTLIDEWGKAGFTFVDLEALSGKLQQAGVVTTNPTADQVKTIANLVDADIIIVGTAIATKQGDVGKLMDDKTGGVQMQSCKGIISARAFNTDNGEILATAEGSKTALHIDTMVCNKTAIVNSAKAFGAEMQAKILTKWNEQVTGGGRIRVTLKNVPNFKAVGELKQALTDEVRGVSTADSKGFRDGTLDLDVRFTGSGEELAAALEGLRKFKISVTGATANTVTAEFKSK